MQEFGANVIADIANIGLHVLHPLTNHEHSCLCLLCSVEEQHKAKMLSKQKRAASLVPLPTSTDLDLIKTGSKSIRQLVVYDETPSLALRSFVSQLKTYVGFKVTMNTLPAVNTSNAEDLAAPFHILVIVIHSVISQEVKTWIQRVCEGNFATRVVLICVPDLKWIFKAPTNPKFTFICYTRYEDTLRAIVHGMMVTKQRLMPKDLSRFLHQNIAEVSTVQQGVCLFY